MGANPFAIFRFGEWPGDFLAWMSNSLKGSLFGGPSSRRNIRGMYDVSCLGEFIAKVPGCVFYFQVWEWWQTNGVNTVVSPKTAGGEKLLSVLKNAGGDD